MLVAGETSSGKSNFLRQVITSLYLNNKNFEFSLVDLKGGLEFSMFRGVKRVVVIDSLVDAVVHLTELQGNVESRMKLLAEAGVKDIDAYNKKVANEARAKGEKVRGKLLGRQILVIDKVAELFLASETRSAENIQAVREIVSRLARQGRAVGQHVILGTQRPDARALDTQIKANLAGKVCFQMAALHSSLVVLGNTRARDLPGIPGRAIWQPGLKMIEVQTPALGNERLLGSKPESESFHNFVLLPEVQSQGRAAQVVLGPETGKTIREVLGKVVQESSEKDWTMFHFDTRKCPYKAKQSPKFSASDFSV